MLTYTYKYIAYIILRHIKRIIYKGLAYDNIAPVYGWTYIPIITSVQQLNLTLFRIKKNFNYTNHCAQTFSILPILPPGLSGKRNRHHIRQRHCLPRMGTLPLVCITLPNPQPKLTVFERDRLGGRISFSIVVCINKILFNSKNGQFY